MFSCEKCGACCHYHKCKYLTENSLCSIYEHRPDRCNVDKMYEKTGQNMTKEEYYKIVKSACNLLRIKEWLDPTIEGFFDKQYKKEREDFRKC